VHPRATDLVPLLVDLALMRECLHGVGVVLAVPHVQSEERHHCTQRASERASRGRGRSRLLAQQRGAGHVDRAEGAAARVAAVMRVWARERVAEVWRGDEMVGIGELKRVRRGRDGWGDAPRMKASEMASDSRTSGLVTLVVRMTSSSALTSSSVSTFPNKRGNSARSMGHGVILRPLRVA